MTFSCNWFRYSQHISISYAVAGFVVMTSDVCLEKVAVFRLMVNLTMPNHRANVVYRIFQIFILCVLWSILSKYFRFHTIDLQRMRGRRKG